MDWIELAQDRDRWCMDWINVAQNRDRWWALVNAEMNFRVT